MTAVSLHVARGRWSPGVRNALPSAVGATSTPCGKPSESSAHSALTRHSIAGGSAARTCSLLCMILANTEEGRPVQRPFHRSATFANWESHTRFHPLQKSTWWTAAPPARSIAAINAHLLFDGSLLIGEINIAGLALLSIVFTSFVIAAKSAIYI
jgi:hypothetical protein